MNASRGALVVNTGFPELNHLAAGLADKDSLSLYVRPYTNLGRHWENALTRIPGVKNMYQSTFGRREMPFPLVKEQICEVAQFSDFLMAAHFRMPFRGPIHQAIRTRLIQHVGDAIAHRGAKSLRDERVVVASWCAARAVFERAKDLGACGVLNYSLAHHAFAHRLLQEEGEREPDFRDTIDSHDWSDSRIAQLDIEIELADYILVGSTFARASFVAQGIPAEKIIVIPYGFEPELFAPRPHDEVHSGFNVIFAGRIGQRKGISYLLRAYERIQSSTTTLTLVGDLPDQGSVFGTWRHLFRHVPHVPRQTLADLLRQSDVFLFPTLVEGMPLVVLEAMASGLPVVTTPNGPGDLVRDGVDGFLVPPRDVDAIVESLEKLQADPELRRWMGRNAAARAREFTWARYRRETAGFVKQLLEPDCL
ncbi:MAG: glycosyltransferase family 4 protein [Metallibacterium sp.]